MDGEMQRLINWLRNESEERMKHAMSRGSSASTMRTATVDELRDSKALAEMMAGRKLKGLSKELVVNYADMQDRIASKLGAEARQLDAWAEMLSRNGVAHD